MSTTYGRNSRRVTANDISSTTLTNMTLISSGDDANGGYSISAYVNSGAGGCGSGVEPLIAVAIKNGICPGWTNVTFKTYGTFVASCWGLNESTAANNLQSYNTSLGDRIFKGENCFELPQFTVKTFACDNDPTNAFHSSFAVGTYRVWYQTRRRSDLTLPGGPGMYLSCNSTGSGSVITISDMYVFY